MNHSPILPSRAPAEREALARARLGLALVASLAFAWTSSLEAQQSVTIPAQSASSLDGQQPGESDGSDLDLPNGPNRPAIERNSNVSQVNVPVPEAESEEEAEPTPPSDSANGDGEVTANQEVPPVMRDFDLEVIRRQAELRRKLSVADAASQARISLPANDLFASNTSAALDQISTSTLKEVIEFIELDEKKNVTVVGYFAPDRTNGRKLAWDRTLSLLDWMAANSELRPERFRAAAPRVVTRPTPKPNSGEASATEFIDRMDLLLVQ